MRAKRQRLDLVDNFLAHLRLTGASGYTVESWGQILDRAHHDLAHGLDEAHGDELLAWLGRPGWSAATRASYRSALRGFYAWACDPGDPWLRDNPAQWLPKVKRSRGVPKPVTDDQLAQILTTATGPVWLWALLAAYQGPRCIEIGRLNREHITEQTTILHGKGDKRRAVPTHPDVWEAVRNLPSGPVARRRDGSPSDGRHVSQTAVRYLHHVLCMPGVSLHRLRHWYLTNVLRICKDLRVAQELAGHASPDTTAVYTAVADEARAAAVSALPRLAGRRDRSGAAGAAPDRGAR
jgi:integrase/recombinase XerC